VGHVLTYLKELILEYAEEACAVMRGLLANGLEDNTFSPSRPTARRIICTSYVVNASDMQ